MEMVTFARRDQANKAGPHTLTILCTLVRSLSQVLIFFNDVLGGNVNNSFFVVSLRSKTRLRNGHRPHCSRSKAGPGYINKAAGVITIALCL